MSAPGGVGGRMTGTGGSQGTSTTGSTTTAQIGTGGTYVQVRVDAGGTVFDSRGLSSPDAATLARPDSGIDARPDSEIDARLDAGISLDSDAQTGNCRRGTYGPPGSVVSVHGRLHIEGTKFVDECGKQVTLRGMSLYDWSQQGRQFYNASAVGHLAKDMKCTVLRIPLLPSNYPGAMGRVKAVMDACIANGIYCIPNWHSFGGGNADAASKFYVELATAYGKTPNIIYEPWNEPTSDSWASIKVFHETVIAAVRSIDPDNIFILGNRQWDQRPDEACADPVTSTKNVAYTVHFYANSHSLSGFQPKIDECLTKGFAIYVTEYGGVDSSGNGTFNVGETQKWWSYLDSKGIGSTNWAVETNGETSSVFVGNASATGPWAQSDLTNSGKTVFSYIASKYDETMAP